MDESDQSSVQRGSAGGAHREVSLVTVTYHSASQMGGLLGSFVRECRRAGVRGEVVVVDHSGDAGERRSLQALAPDQLIEQPNRGYGAGLNRGADAAAGDVLLLANPDVELLPGSLAALLGGLAGGADVVGPLFSWDRDGRVLHPPAEDPTPAVELMLALARSSPWYWRRQVGRWLASLMEVWTAETPVDVPSLRGSLMALNRSGWQRFGGFDERYFLYSEETDWLWRARAQGARIQQVPGARVVHSWAHTTWRLDDREAIERRSRRLFQRLHYPWHWRVLIQSAERLPQRAGVRPEPLASPEQVVAANDVTLYVLSPFEHLMPSLLVPATALNELTACAADGRWVLAELRPVGTSWTIGQAFSWGS